jgi:hypothetical protein
MRLVHTQWSPRIDVQAAQCEGIYRAYDANGVESLVCCLYTIHTLAWQQLAHHATHCNLVERTLVSGASGTDARSYYRGLSTCSFSQGGH